MEVGAIIILLLCRGLLAETPSPCGDQGSVEVVGARTLPNGGLQAKDRTRFPPGCTWISHPPGLPLIILGCTAKVKPCIWQCCPDGQTLSPTFKCQPSNEIVLPIRPSSSDKFDIDNFHILKGNPCSYQRYIVHTQRPFSITDNGTLLETKSTDSTSTNKYDPGLFCMEVTEKRTFVMGCVVEKDWKPPPPPEDDDLRYEMTYVIYSVCRIITLPFLVATVVVYAVLPDLRNLHGKCLMSHVGSLTVAYIFVVVIQLGSRMIWSWFCVTSAFCVYFFMLVSFFWLNVMCFDIWWTFSGFRGVSGRKGEREERLFWCYSLYSWGAAFLMLCVSLFMEYSSVVPDKYLKPRFGVNYCWFITKRTNLAYFSGPVFVIIVANIALFVVTAFHIFKIKRDTAVLAGSESARNNLKRNNERFVLYLKLFVVMGVPWSLDLLGWAVGGSDYYWYVTDILNIMQGIPIFIIFVCKPSVWKQLRERWCKKRSTATSVTPTVSTSVSNNSIPMT